MNPCPLHDLAAFIAAGCTGQSSISGVVEITIPPGAGRCDGEAGDLRQQLGERPPARERARSLPSVSSIRAQASRLAS